MKPSRWFIAWYFPFNLQNTNLLLLQFAACTAQMSFHTLQGNRCISTSKFPWVQVLSSLWFALSEVCFSPVSCNSVKSTLLKLHNEIFSDTVLIQDGIAKCSPVMFWLINRSILIVYLCMCRCLLWTLLFYLPSFNCRSHIVPQLSCGWKQIFYQWGTDYMHLLPWTHYPACEGMEENSTS